MKNALLIVLTMTMIPCTMGQERTVKTDRSYQVRNNAWVDVAGKYGDIHIDTHHGSYVDINVSVSVRASSMKDIDKMLDKIKVDIDGNEKLVSIRSTIDNIAQWNSNKNSSKGGTVQIVFTDGTRVQLEEFSIDYRLSIPITNHVKLDNKYGDIYIDDLEGNANIQLKYGHLEAESLHGKTKLILGYAKANIEHVNRGDFEIKYTQLNLESIKALKLESRYSNFEIEKADTLLSDSRYNGYDLGEVDYLIAVERNSNMNIEELFEFGSFEMRYGKLRIEELKRSFDSFRFEGEYTDCVVNVEDETNYSLDISSKYATIKYPRNTNIRQQIEDRSSKKIVGSVGSLSRSHIQIRTRYGDVTIN